MKGIPKEPMPSTLVQNTPFHNLGEELSQQIHKQPKSEDKICGFIMQQSTDYNKVQ
jgi:hypothetical protein